MKTILSLFLLVALLNVASAEKLTYYTQEQLRACKLAVAGCHDYLGSNRQFQYCVESDLDDKYTFQQCISTIQDFMENPQPADCSAKNTSECKKVADHCHQYLGGWEHMICFVVNTDLTPEQCQTCIKKQADRPINGPCSDQDTNTCKSAATKCHKFLGSWTYQSCFNDKQPNLTPEQCQKCIENAPEETVKDTCSQDETIECKKAANNCRSLLGKWEYRGCFSDTYDKLSIEQCKKCIENAENAPVSDTCNASQIKTCKVGAMACRPLLGKFEYRGCFDSKVNNSISLQQCVKCLEQQQY